MAKLDRFGNELGGLGFGHFMGHEGKIHQADVSWSAVGAAATQTLGILTGAKEVHMKSLSLQTLGTWKLTLREAPTSVAAGTAFVPWNRNRGRAATATALTSVWKTGVTGATGGTSLPLGRILAGTGVGQSATLGGSEGSWDDEIVLKANTQYVIEFLSGATTGNELNADMLFAEATV